LERLTLSTCPQSPLRGGRTQSVGHRHHPGIEPGPGTGGGKGPRSFGDRRGRTGIDGPARPGLGLPPKKTARLPHRAVVAVIVRGESDESAVSLAGEVRRTRRIVRGTDDIDMTAAFLPRGECPFCKLCTKSIWRGWRTYFEPVHTIILQLIDFTESIV